MLDPTQRRDITVRIGPGVECDFGAVAVLHDEVCTVAEHDNPYEAAWNALAEAMTKLGYDEDGCP